MCDTPTEYKHGDVAWVKLGSCWWPGEVTDFEQLEEAVKEDLKSSSRGKLPLAVVKFFQEDSYEYVKKNDQIYPYNCSKKDEFIRKGLDMHRAKKSNMEKFPEDVVTAEKKTNGDENIINDEKYTLPKKKDVIKISEIFGTPKLKASPKPPGRSKGSAVPTPGKNTPARFVTHPRFIGKRNDHQRVVLVQQKKEEAKVNASLYKCSICGFASNRVNSVALHSKIHIKTDPLFNDVRKKAKKRGPKKKSVAPPNDVDQLDALERTESVSAGEASDVEPPERTQKKRRKRKRAPAPAAQEDAAVAKKPAPDITNDLLAEWDDGDDDEDDDDKDMDFDADAPDAGAHKTAEASPKAAKGKSPARAAKHAPKEQENGAKTTAEKLELDFTSLMESTKVPEMPKADVLKIGAKSPEIATKLTNPKKRFVKSFEDFELSMKEKQLEKEKEKDSDVKIAEEKADVKDSSEAEAEVEGEEKKDADSLEEKTKPAEDKKHTRRSTRFDKEKDKEKEKAPEKVDEKESEQENPLEDPLPEKPARRSSLRAEREEDKEDEKKSEEKSEPDEKKPTRRASARAESEKVEKDEIAEDKKTARRGSTKEKLDKPEKVEKIDEKDNEPRKSSRRSEIKPKEDDKKPAAEAEAGDEPEKRDKSPKKAKDDAKQSKDSKVDADKGKKDAKVAKTDERAPKKEDKPEEKAAPVKKDLEKVEGKDKSEKKLKPSEKVKPKEKLLFEIDVFGSLRAQENEKYNKKAEDSPRRETRASRSKSSSHSDNGLEKKEKEKEKEKEKIKDKDMEKIAPKKSKKDDDDAQVNNGKSDESGSPLISKMKNKLMNKLTTEVVEPPQKAKTRQRTPSRTMSADDADAKVEPKEQKEQKKEEKKGVSRQRGHSSSNEEVDNLSDAKSDDDEVAKAPKTPEPSRRDSLRSTPSTAKSDDLKIDESTPKSEEKKAVGSAKGGEKVATKAEMKSPPLPTPAPKSAGRSPKTYLRSSRPDKTDASPTAKSPARPEAQAEDVKTTADVATPVEGDAGESLTKEDVKLSGEALLDELTKLHAPPEESADDWLKALSPPKRKVASRDASPAKEAKSPGSPARAPAKAPPSPVKTPTPSSPVKTPTPSSPVKTPTPLSPVKTPTPSSLAVAAAPSSPTKTPISSPVRQSPMKSPPIILNKEAAKFDPASTPKKVVKRDEEAPKPAVKSPRRISLTSQEVSITDKVEVSSNNNEAGGVVEEEQPAEKPAEIVQAEDEQQAAATEASADPLDLLASVSTLNKDVIEKNVTVVPENILADGQMEIAKIIEGGTEKVASIPKVAPAEKDKSEPIVEKGEQQSEEVKQDEAPSQKPIILNSRLAAADQESTTKLLDILSDKRVSTPSAKTQQTQQVPLPKIANPKFDVDAKKQPAGKPVGRIIAGSSPSASTSRTKPTILSDTIIRPADSVVSVQKVKRTYDDIEDIDAFIITKHPKKAPAEEEGKKPAAPTVAAKSKPKILEHTIITAAGQVLQPISKVKKPIVQQQTIKVPSGSAKTVEEKVYDLLNSPKGKEDDAFDIDNMPIVLGDSLISESIESDGGKAAAVPQVVRKTVAQQIKPIPKQTVATASALKTTPVSKTYTKVVKAGQRIYQPAVATTSPAVAKHQPTILSSSKQGKFVIVPSQSTAVPGSKYTVGKRPLVKKQPAILQSKAATSESGGSKIMIVTNNQGQQQRVLITPENQRLLGYQGQVKKTIVKAASPAQIKDRTKVVAHSQASPGPGLMAVKKPKIETKPVAAVQQKVGQKFSLQGAFPPMKGSPGQTRTVIIKNQQGEVVNRIHGTSDEEIEKKVAEQLEAINRAASKNKAGAMPVKRVIKKAAPVSDATRTAIQQKAVNVGSPAQRNAVPPLAPITSSAKKPEPPKQIVRQQKTVAAPLAQKTAGASVVAKVEAPKTAEKKEERPPKQLVIQDAMGNETTIMEGQILALPSETVDGQPQSYMLVTLDESGSLTPLNNEALMSLDPNLNLGGDWSNMVLQIEGSGAGTETTDSTTTTQATKTKATPQKQPEIQKQVDAKAELVAPAPLAELPPEESQQQAQAPAPALDQVGADVADVGVDPEAPTEQIHAITCSINKGDTQQNLIITGDPVATQKFLESLTEGNPEIANLLAHVEGQNILIHTDGQQILINSDVDNNMLMSLNSQLGAEAGEDASQMFGAQSAAKNQDILAAALADTDVFQQEQQTVAAGKLPQSQAQLSPGYPLAANNVLETSTVNSPIMTPLEVPSASAKIKESDVLNQQVPKNVDLPITITDPNIAQSVSNQQVNLLQAELAAGIELPLTIPDVPATSAEMSSPSFYSLPSLDDGEKFASPMSMPLLTEDPEDVQPAEKDPTEDDKASSSSAVEAGADDAKPQEGTAEYLLATGDMCTMSSQMSSLSEPPPDMFDFPVEQTSVFCNSSEPTDESILEGKSPKRGLDDADASEEKRAKLD